MKKKICVPVALIVAVTAVLIVAVLAVSPSISQSRSKHDLILMRCEMSGQDFKVSNYSGSQSAPSKSTDNCAETLARHHRDGFGVESVGYFDSGEGYIVYTLVR